MPTHPSRPGAIVESLPQPTATASRGAVAGPLDAAGAAPTHLSITVPVYNEVDNLGALVDEIVSVLDGLHRTYEIIVVDDGSTDGTAELLRAFATQKPGVKGVFLRRNFGQAAAFDAGFRFATGQVVVTMDGDLQNDPHDIPRMLAKLEEGFDVVAGWRRNRQDGMLLRKLPSRTANWLIRRITRVPVHDLGCSLRAYRKYVTTELRLYGEMHRFISVLAYNMGAKITELEVNHRPRRMGVSKYDLRRSVKVILDLITVLFLRRYGTKPMYVFGGLGALIFAAASVMFCVVLWEKLAEGIWVHRNPLFIVAVMATLVSVQLAATGLIAELIVRTQYESRDKHAYSVGDRAGFDDC
jgi:glycosyltransferase involved in cell wall biosynthesis